VFQVLVNPNFDFMGKRNVLLVCSLVVVVASAVVLAVHGINLGIEFQGGTELQVRFIESPDLGAVRSVLGDAGLRNYQVTTIGEPAHNDVYIRVGLSGSEAEERDQVISAVLDALTPVELGDLAATGIIDLNRISQHELLNKLAAAPGLTEGDAALLAAAVLEVRRENAIIRSMDELADLPGMTPEVFDFLEKQTTLGPFALRSQSFIGPAIGRELMDKALWAVIGSLAGMLVYIWIRFQFQWGLAAVVALAHDTVITLGLFSLFGMEMSLPVVAAFLTLIGYSVNDTVVVFDRIRESTRTKGSMMAFTDLVNLSINRTLSRTIITSGLTWIVVLALFLFGGESLASFAFVLVVGTVVGTYSSIYIASPILVVWRSLVAGRARSKQASRTPARRSATKKKLT
jgi:preprotein translocase subunit SecF